MSVVTASNNYVNTLNIQLPFACNAQIIKDFLPITTDKEGKVLKFLIFQRVKKTCLYLELSLQKPPRPKNLGGT